MPDDVIERGVEILYATDQFSRIEARFAMNVLLANNVFRPGDKITTADGVECVVVPVDMFRDANETCRSALAIAKRRGDETNWEPWIRHLKTALDKQHAMIQAPSATKEDRETPTKDCGKPPLEADNHGSAE